MGQKYSFKKVDIKFFIIILLCIASGIVSWHMYFKEYLQSDTVNIHIFPMQIGKWHAEEIPISKQDYAILETKNAFVRRYTDNKGNEVYLYIVYSQHNRKVSHPPELCYSGAGNLIIDKSIVTLPVGKKGVKAVRLFMERGHLQHIAYYWFKVGDSFTTSYWKQQALIALKTILGQSSSSALIRISTIIHGDRIKEAENTVKLFSREIAPLLKKYLP